LNSNPSGVASYARLRWPDDLPRYYAPGRYGQSRTGENEPTFGVSSARSTSEDCGKNNRRLFVSLLPENQSRHGEMLLSIATRIGEPRSPRGIRRHYCPDVRSTCDLNFACRTAFDHNADTSGTRIP